MAFLAQEHEFRMRCLDLLPDRQHGSHPVVGEGFLYRRVGGVAGVSRYYEVFFQLDGVVQSRVVAANSMYVAARRLQELVPEAVVKQVVFSHGE